MFVSDSRFLRIVDIVIGRIIIPLTLFHVTTLFLCIALAAILHADTRNLLGNLFHGDYAAREVDRILLVTEHITGKVSTDMFLLVVILKLNAKRCPERIQHRLHGFVGEVVAVGIHQHDISLQTLTRLCRFNSDRLHTVHTYSSMAIIRLTVERIVIMVFAIVELLALYVRDYKLTTTATTLQPFVDLINRLEITIHVRVLLFLIVLAVCRKEAQAAHVFHLQQFGVVKADTQEREKAVEEVKHIEADARLRTVGLQHPIRPVVVRSCVLCLRTGLRGCLTVFVDIIVCIADTGITVFRRRIGIAHIDKRCLYLGNDYLLIIAITLFLTLYRFFLGA